MKSDPTDAQSIATLESVRRFNEAFNRHDVDGVMAAMTDDCVFENTNPAPDGKRYQGQAEVRAFWQRFFQNYPDALFEAVEMFAAGDPCVVRWIYRKERTANRGTCVASICFECATARWQRNLLM